MHGFFQDDFDVGVLNATNLVMIPKVECLEQVGHFRPISLCYYSYKIISKVIANKMKTIMPKVITKNQRAFVYGRHIHGNVLVVHKAFQYLRSRVNGRKYELAVKLNMNKAYDKVEWDFLRDVLLNMGFSPGWVDKIMLCVNTVSFDILLSGKSVAKFTPKRGLRQGDPLSPYRFIVVADVLSRMLIDMESQGAIKGIKLARTYPVLTHCAFADDSMFVLKVNSEIANLSNPVLRNIALPQPDGKS